MKKVPVRYEGWGENWLLGTLADDGHHLLFEYSPQALAEGLDLSPRYLPLQKQAIGSFPSHLWRLPGFCDSSARGFAALSKQHGKTRVHISEFLSNSLDASRHEFRV